METSCYLVTSKWVHKSSREGQPVALDIPKANAKETAPHHGTILLSTTFLNSSPHTADLSPVHCQLTAQNHLFLLPKSLQKASSPRFSSSLSSQQPLLSQSMAPSVASPSASAIVALVFPLFACSLMAITSAGNFHQQFQITWGNERAKILDNGQYLTLSLDKASGSGFQSKNEYLFGKIDMQLKLVSGNSAGTVTAYYVSTYFLDTTSQVCGLIGVPRTSGLSFFFFFGLAVVFTRTNS